MTMNVTDKASWGIFRKHFSADLITLVYFRSEVYAQRQECDEYFHTLFANAKTDAAFLLIDNPGPFTDWFGELANQYGLEVELSHRDRGMRLTSDEAKTDLGKYFDKSRFQQPKLTGDVEFRVARKP